MCDLSQAIVSEIVASGLNESLLCGCTGLMLRTKHAVATSTIVILAGLVILSLLLKPLQLVTRILRPWTTI
jgi:hypothetical protein